jgi:hypothetical protein
VPDYTTWGLGKAIDGMPLIIAGDEGADEAEQPIKAKLDDWEEIYNCKSKRVVFMRRAIVDMAGLVVTKPKPKPAIKEQRPIPRKANGQPIVRKPVSTARGAAPASTVRRPTLSSNLRKTTAKPAKPVELGESFDVLAGKGGESGYDADVRLEM